MSATTGLQFEIDGGIQASPDLHASVHKATEYLESLMAEHPELGAENRAVKWILRRHAEHPAQVEVHYSEQDSYGQRQQVTWFPLGDMLDPVKRDIGMIRVYRRSLAERWRQIDKKMERDIRALEAEESHGKSIAQ